MSGSPTPAARALPEARPRPEEDHDGEQIKNAPQTKLVKELDRQPMVSLKTKKTKKTSRGK